MSAPGLRHKNCLMMTTKNKQGCQQIKVDGYFRRTCGSSTSTSSWDPDCRIRWAGRRGKGPKINKMTVFAWCEQKVDNKGVSDDRENGEKQSHHQTELCLSASKHRDWKHNGLLSKPTEAPSLVWQNVGNETMVGRAKKKPAARMKT